jgi:hypothetical protein
MNTLMAIETQKKYGGISLSLVILDKWNLAWHYLYSEEFPEFHHLLRQVLSFEEMPPNIQYCTYYNRDRDSINTGLFDDYCRRTGGNNALWFYVTN